MSVCELRRPKGCFQALFRPCALILCSSSSGSDLGSMQAPSCCFKWIAHKRAVVCKVAAYKRAKSKLGVGQEDKYSYGHSIGPSGVLAVDVPNYQLQAQRRQTLQQAQMTGQQLPQLPTPFAAAQVPLPDDSEPGETHLPHSRAGSLPSTTHPNASADLAGGTAAQRGSTPLHRQSLVPGHASAAPGASRLGSAPPGIKVKPASGIRRGSSVLPQHKSAPGLGKLLCSNSHIIYPCPLCSAVTRLVPSVLSASLLTISADLSFHNS